MTERDYLYIIEWDQNNEHEAQRLAKAEQDLIDHYHKIKMKQDENEFLGVVVADYNRYFDHIRGEKQRQYEAIRGLVDYIDKLTSDMDTANQILRQTKYDQEALLREMRELKQKIDEEIPNANFEV